MPGQTLRQRLVVALMDGLGMDYYENSPMPVLKGMAQQGFFRPVRAVSPTVTNVNNVSVCCGAWPDEHGIAANSHYDPATGQAVYMNAADLIRTDTIFQWARQQGTQGVLLTSRRKTAVFVRLCGLSLKRRDAHDDKLGRSRRGGCLPGNATAAHFLKKSA